MSIKIAQSKTQIDDNIINAMVGDISYDDLVKVEGVSSIALLVKKKSSYSFSLFKKNDNRCILADTPMSLISYRNVKLLKRFISTRGKIISIRNNGIRNKSKQRKLKQAILHARFLGLLPYVAY